MNEKLVRLIDDFQGNVLNALKLMQRSGIRMPLSRNDWIESNIPITGELDGGAKYYKHGAGCLVSLNANKVDFDFGEEGEIGGFNLWWLAKFAGENLTSYGFKNAGDLNECWNKALDAGEFICPDYGLYYKANTPYIYATDIDSREPHDILPTRNQDPVLVLQSHYFQSAELMLENYNKLSRKFNKIGRLSRREEIEMRIYLTTWLGFLGVVCEGVRKLKIHILLGSERPDIFKELLPLSDKIGQQMKEHSDSLRKFRNNVFHLRENTKLVRDFFDKRLDRIQWALELHMTLSKFFSQYKISCEIHYLRNGRKGECDLIRNKRVLLKR